VVTATLVNTNGSVGIVIAPPSQIASTIAEEKKGGGASSGAAAIVPAGGHSSIEAHLELLLEDLTTFSTQVSCYSVSPLSLLASHRLRWVQLLRW
jgi:hypothetical protein